MIYKTILTAAAASVLMSGVALAAGVSDVDKTFLTKDVQGARYELALAQTAAVKASRPQVRSYASMVARDHEHANATLMQLVKEEGVQAPDGMPQQDGQTLAKLKSMSGPAFDKAYLDEVTRINAKDQSDSNQEASSTRDPRIKAYIQKFSSMDARHKTDGEALQKT